MNVRAFIITGKNRQYKDAIFEQFARIGKAVSSPARLELLELLCQGPQAVEVLAEKACMSVANTSQHLKVLGNSRLVDSRKNGRFVTYSIADETAYDYFQSMRRLAEVRLAEVENITRHFLEGRHGMEPADYKALLSQVHKGMGTVLDVRPVDEYRAGHIPGAVSIPLKELEDRFSELPKEREIVAYCRGPYCVLAMQAVELLHKKGFRAVRLKDGVVDWRERGLPVAACD